MARLYSSALYVAENLMGDLSEPVPAGEVWVVRDVTLLQFAGSAGAASNVYVGDALTLWFIAAHLDPTVADAYYHWEGRQVIAPGSAIRVLTGESTQVRISGYILTLP